MKPQELLDSVDGKLGNGRRVEAYADTRRVFEFYKDIECIVAYRQSFAGVVFLIKGARELFGFRVLTSSITRWGRTSLHRIVNLRSVKMLFERKGEDKLIILDDDNYKLFERSVLFSAIK